MTQLCFLSHQFGKYLRRVTYPVALTAMKMLTGPIDFGRSEFAPRCEK